MNKKERPEKAVITYAIYQQGKDIHLHGGLLMYSDSERMMRMGNCIDIATRAAMDKVLEWLQEGRLIEKSMVEDEARAAAAHFLNNYPL